jgi:hypothetical protein
MKRDDIMHGIALLAVLALPLALFYARAVADVLIVAVDILFLLRGQWGWARRPWVKLAAAIWLLQLAASVLYGPGKSAFEALVMFRMFLFVAALEDWVLAGAAARRAMWVVFLVLAVWTASQCWEQYLTGHDLMGARRWGDGSLTGPFYKPRCGPIFLYLVLPGVMPLVLRLVAAPRWRAWAGGLALLLACVATSILIGQRMPNVLFLLGLCITGLLVRRFRAPLLIAIAVGALAVAALPVISPPTFAKLVVKFASQMSHFAASPYGQLYTRASVMIAARPWLGFGFEGFQDFCGQTQFWHGWPALGIPDAENGGIKACNLHPHNYYLQLGTMAGLPGLALFVALVVTWLRRMAAALRPGADGVQAMLFVTCCVLFWPLASTSGLFTLDTAGWVFLITGWGLAASRRAE